MDTSAKMDVKEKLSLLWIFVMFNYLYCDVISFFDPGTIAELMTGSVGGIQFTQEFLLGAAVLMEIPIAMVLLSRVLAYRINRWANIIAGALMTVVQFSSLFFGSQPAVYYIFFSIIEIACTSLIVWYAWNWHASSVLVGEGE